jgi:hypothetical protein
MKLICLGYFLFFVFVDVCLGQIICRSTQVNPAGQLEDLELRIQNQHDSDLILMTITSQDTIRSSPLSYFRSLGQEEIFELHPNVFEALDLLALHPHEVNRGSVHESSQATLLTFFGAYGHPRRALIHGHQISECR